MAGAMWAARLALATRRGANGAALALQRGGVAIGNLRLLAVSDVLWLGRTDGPTQRNTAEYYMAEQARAEGVGVR